MNRGVGGACHKHSTDQLSELRASLPPHTCPTIAPVVAYLEARGRDDLVNLVSVWMADTAKGLEPSPSLRCDWQTPTTQTEMRGRSRVAAH
jgi:hypothetical protein